LGFFVCLIGIGKGNPWIFLNVCWWDLEFNDLGVTCEFQFLIGFFSIFFLVRFLIEGFRRSFSTLRLWDLHLGLCFCDWILNLCFRLFLLEKWLDHTRTIRAESEAQIFKVQGPDFGCEISMFGREERRKKVSRAAATPDLLFFFFFLVFWFFFCAFVLILFFVFFYKKKTWYYTMWHFETTCTMPRVR
jgi:hypothetical protein